MLKLFNTLTQKKEDFHPADVRRVRLYNCGPTVYNFNHIGNFRSYIAVDQLRRYLKLRGYGVDHTSNITDIDDKIIDNAISRNQTIEEFVAPYIKAFLEDLGTLNIEAVEHRPLATHYINDMQQMMADLEKNGLTYVVDGSVYYRIASYRQYGSLAHLDQENLVTGAGGRFDADEYTKEDARDFALWKRTTRPGEPSWPSAWGPGRPGWHIECSAMIRSIYGEGGIDIHAGGVDLIFPHHENEMAQSCGAHPGEAFVGTWFHNEHLLVEGKKMSKSLGNFYTLRELVTEDGARSLVGSGRAPEWLLDFVKDGIIAKAIRYVLLSTNYRMKLNFTFAQIQSARSSLERMQKAVDRLREATGCTQSDLEMLFRKGQSEAAPGHAGPELAGRTQAPARTMAEFIESMDDDLNISRALAALFELIPAANSALDSGKTTREELVDFLAAFYAMDRVLGLMRFDPAIAAEQNEEDAALASMVQDEIRKRNEARARKDFSEADRIRKALLDRGIVLKDTPKGTLWEKA